MSSDRIPGDQGDEDRPKDPLAELLAQFGISFGDGPIDWNTVAGQLSGQFGMLNQQLNAMFAGGADGSPVNWEFVKDIARKSVAQLGPDPTPDQAQRRAVRDDAELAEQWLGDKLAFDPVPGEARAWSRAEWVEATMPTWQSLVTPVVGSVAQAMGDMLTDDDDPAAQQGAAMMKSMLQQAAGAVFASQAGAAIGQLAAAVVSGSDIGLPVLREPAVALLPANLEAFSAELDVPARDIGIYLALRETARVRLYQAVGWLAPQLLALVEHYARGITIDRSAMEDAMGDAAPTDAESLMAMSQRVSGTLFEPTQTPEQKEILARLETLVALVEGWVDDVVQDAAGPWMPNAPALLEIVRRRRATGGPTENALKTLVGLELRPRRVRDAANLWAALRAKRGVEGRDAVWHHPDLMPSAADLDDPLGFVDGDPMTAEPDDMDRELEKLLGQEPPEPKQG